MSCIAAARGIRQTPPHTGMAFEPLTDNDPCGKNHVLSVNGVDVSAHSLCLPHLALKIGLEGFHAPIVIS